MMAAAGNQPGPNNAYMIYIPCIVFLIICPILVGLRIWARVWTSAGLGPDDWTILASLLFSIASSLVMMMGCYYGFGQHVALLSFHNKRMALLYFYVCQVIYKASINCTKASILFLYTRIFVQKPFRIICYVLIGIIASYAIASIAGTIFQCTPVPRAFDKTIAGTCIDMEMFWYANAGFSIATDIIILVIPMPIILGLNLARIQKIALMLIFALGGFVVITSCLRMTTIKFATLTPDTTYDISSTMWTMIEPNIAIICACLPMIRPLISRAFPGIFPSSHRSTMPHYGSQSANTHNGHKELSSSGGWSPTRGDTKDHIHLNTIRGNETASEEYILGDDETHASDHNIRIQKTVQVSVDYDDKQRR